MTEISKKSNQSLNDTSYYLLKYIAIIIMVAEHLGCIISFSGETLYVLNMLLRVPISIFAFELVECFHHTKNKKKHLINLLVLAIISEPFFDLMIFSDTLGYQFCLEKFQHQNVIFTLLIAFIMLIGLNKDWKKIINSISEKINFKMLKNEKLNKILVVSIKAIIVLGSIILSKILKADYNTNGIIFILFLEIAYSNEHKKIFQFYSFLFLVNSFNEIESITIFLVFILILIAEKNKNAENKFEKINKIVTSKPSKIICRFFYPVHLLIIVLIKMCIDF